MGGRTIYTTLSPKRTPFQTGTDRWPHLRKVPAKRRISHTHPMWLWSHSLFEISSLGPLFYGTKLLLWRPHKQSPTFHSKCRIDKGLNKKGEALLKVAVQGPEGSTPYAFTHLFKDTTPFLVNHRRREIIEHGHELIQSETMFWRLYNHAWMNSDPFVWSCVEWSTITFSNTSKPNVPAEDMSLHLHVVCHLFLPRITATPLTQIYRYILSLEWLWL
jgi:hypothetical protein